MPFAEIIKFPQHRRRTRAGTRQPASPDKLQRYRLVQLGQWWRPGAVGGVSEPGELAKRYRQLAERCRRLAAIASEPAASDGFRRMGDELAAKANHLEAKRAQGNQSGAG
jgi:hypothetical protein